ncbi:putative MFS family arabinose efflux permease [Microbacterium ginsengiterrae]|uniref:Putative MFS family arabinose efflux permease n=1 Tax=Microbacterium ginsengiterrae TaxID=546115 RepID=A0A7W9CDF3_9MICO|nr:MULTISPECIES: MFS transporter [Microbacterium]MBB5743574.1 putative MFS family arabinose efflux permease [Microbacterium ginsengiterrae]
MTHETSSEKAAFPWSPVLVLAVATMLMVTSEMLPTAVLAPMSAGLGVDEAETGALVSIWAAVVVIASFPLSRLGRRWPARPVIIVALVILAVSALLTAAAPTYLIALAARILGAAAVGLLWATVNAFVADLVTDRMLGRAVGIVLGGGTLGMVIGTPLGRLLAEASDWRVAFAVLGVLLLVIAAGVRVAVPSVPRRRTAASGASVRGRAGGGMLGIVTALVAVALIGHYGAFTFITRLVEPAASLVPGGMSAVLLMFGVASAVGVAIAARVGENTVRALVVSVAVTGLAVAALVTSSAPVVSVIIVVVWGIGSGAFPPLAQTLILRIAGPERRDFAGALIPVLFNGGIAVGAGAASGLVSVGGPSAVPLPAAAVIVVAAILIGTSARRPVARPSVTVR